MVRRLKKRRTKRVEVPLMDVDLWLSSGYDYFEHLQDYGFELAPRPGRIQDATLLLIWADYRQDIEAEWINSRSPFYNHPSDQREPYIYEVLQRCGYKGKITT
ncbi:hypothetical protein EN873_24405 [bacterium M00.F.Ca.ET.230.01.1.1]|nr:hypothetical protein EN873_24405 [bacterium M00.F.Ca.ET.230.01.1.1]